MLGRERSAVSVRPFILPKRVQDFSVGSALGKDSQKIHSTCSQASDVPLAGNVDEVELATAAGQ